MRRHRKIISVVIVLGLLLTGWLLANPPGRFGWSCYAYTTFGALPCPISDFQVRADGSTRNVDKTHELSFERIDWLLDPQPEVLIIGLGWDGVTEPAARIRNYKDCEVHFLKNDEAIELFNRLKKEGKRVAIHYHSTC